MIVKRFNVDLELKQTTSNREFRVIEGDTGNIILVKLTDEGSAVDLSGCRVIAVFSKTNGTSMQDSGFADNGITIGGTYRNEIEISLFPASFAPGLVECELQIYSDESMSMLVTTAKFNFFCDRAIFNEQTAQATNEYPLLIDLIQRIEDFPNAEAERVAAEAGRIEAETGRVNAETARQNAETARVRGEDSRIMAEKNRQTSEQARNTAEDQRRAEHQKWTNVSAGARTLGSDAAATVLLTEFNGRKRFEFGIPAGRDGVVSRIDAGFFFMSVSEEGHLLLHMNDGETPPPLSISSSGHLIYTID